MDFSLSDEQKAFVETTRQFAQDRLAPNYRNADRTATLDRQMCLEMGELGLIGVDLPEEYGGLGLDSMTMGLVTEEVSAGDMNAAYVPMLSALITQIMLRHCSAEICAEWLPKVCRGEKLLALALTEPSAGSDAASLKLKATRTNDGFILDGEKTSISMAAQADAAVVFARTGSTEDRAHGITAFFVELNQDGITRTQFEDHGSRSVGRGSLFFDGVKVPTENQVGDEGRGFVQVMQGFDFSRALIGLQCLAVARQSLEETWEYVKERQSFGKMLAVNQGVTFPLAEAETMVEAARNLCLKTLWLKDQGLPHTAEAAMCKWWAPKVSYEAVHQCLLLHGHGGYSGELPYEQRMRDLLGLQIGDGTAQIMKLVIARQKLGERV